jgi:preprotein translocase subunit SecD
VLTLGMAVDANVLIFERIREELRLGKPPRAAVEAGFSRAWSAILDGNVTTLIAAAMLFQFGTGPIKGFAVTLSLGLLANLFTAVFVCKFIFESALAFRPIQRLSI